jgi:hypothetical protein
LAIATAELSPLATTAVAKTADFNGFMAQDSNNRQSCVQ